MNSISDVKCEEVETADSETEQEKMVGLLALCWEDIIFSHILPFLDWKDLFNLRSVCWGYKQMVDAYFKQLKSADFTTVYNTFTDEAFQLVTQNCTNLRKMIINRSKWIIDRDLYKVFRNNKSLAHVDLTECSCLNGSCILPLAVNCKQLHTLILRQCNWLTHGAVETLITHLDSLEIVDLSCCSGISNQILLPFVQKFNKLKELHLANLPPINDTTLLISRNYGDSLTHLDIAGCQNVTDRGVKMLVEYCMKLKTLQVSGSNLVTEYSLSLLRARGVQIDREKAGELVPYIPFYLQVEFRQRRKKDKQRQDEGGFCNG